MKIPNAKPFSLMTGNNPFSFLLVIIVFLFTVLLIYLKNGKVVDYPFKCYGFVEYNLLDGRDIVTYDSSQDLRIFSDGVAYVSFSGMVKFRNNETILNRTINLKNVKHLDKNTISFDIDSFQKSMSDNTPDELYDILLNEYLFQRKKFNLDVVNVDKSTWVLGTSSSFIMSCVEY